MCDSLGNIKELTSKKSWVKVEDTHKLGEDCCEYYL
jgi:hypothetical protein